jgi:hypothetical protein
MNNNILSPYCRTTSKHTFKILEGLSVTVSVNENPLQLPMDALFEMAARINKKRSFLFVSTVLGKHIPVDPYLSLLSGAALSLLLYNEINHGKDEQIEILLSLTIKGLTRTLDARIAYQSIMDSSLQLPYPLKFIGFAETATALGHSMYNVFDGGCTYIHTTREIILSMTSLINFEEEHSHAVSHYCYALNSELIAGEETIVLVDDEITTGNTALNIIKDIQAKFPRKNYVIASLLDWRTVEDERRYAELEEELGISIKSVSLIKGRIEVDGKPNLPGDLAINTNLTETNLTEFIYINQLFEHLNHSSYLKGTGRFGINQLDNVNNDQSITAAAKILIKYRSGGNTLCLGTGEFMYIPMRISAEMGNGLLYHSTTRSPIYSSSEAEYAIKNGISFPSPDDKGLDNFIYNIPRCHYDDLFLFIERDFTPGSLAPMLSAFQSLGFKQINVVICGPKCC